MKGLQIVYLRSHSENFHTHLVPLCSQAHNRIISFSYSQHRTPSLHSIQTRTPVLFLPFGVITSSHTPLSLLSRYL